MPDSADDPLLQGLRQGDEQAFATLYDQYAKRMYRVALALCRSSADAEDAVHDAFVGIWQARQKLGEVQNVAAYLFTALRHATAKVRERALRTDLSADLGQHLAALDEASSLERDEHLRKLLASLPVEQRDVVVMKLYGELTFAEIAAALAISPNTAASRYRYALEKLRTAMQSESSGD
jgi:RNA polymerase sigma-70 factor, ECF subfamily